MAILRQTRCGAKAPRRRGASGGAAKRGQKGHAKSQRRKDAERLGMSSEHSATNSPLKMAHLSSKEDFKPGRTESKELYEFVDQMELRDSYGWRVDKPAINSSKAGQILIDVKGC